MSSTLPPTDAYAPPATPSEAAPHAAGPAWHRIVGWIGVGILVAIGLGLGAVGGVVLALVTGLINIGC